MSLEIRDWTEMALKSYLFSGDRALQSCSVQDSAHLMEGASGQHVGKIQAALKFLEDAAIEIREIRTRFYGPSTAAAVLRYKQKRKIINHALSDLGRQHCREDNYCGPGQRISEQTGNRCSTGDRVAVSEADDPC